MLQRLDGGQQPDVESLNPRADIWQMGRNEMRRTTELLQRGQTDDARITNWLKPCLVQQRRACARGLRAGVARQDWADTDSSQTAKGAL